VGIHLRHFWIARCYASRNHGIGGDRHSDEKFSGENFITESIFTFGQQKNKYEENRIMLMDSFGISPCQFEG
jgi:hypothetical protein